MREFVGEEVQMDTVGPMTVSQTSSNRGPGSLGCGWEALSQKLPTSPSRSPNPCSLANNQNA